MLKLSDVVMDPAGNVLAGALVTVKEAGTETLATLYSDDGVTPLANPVTTDSNGVFAFYVADGDYDLVPSKANYTGGARTDVTIGGGGGVGPTWTQYQQTDYYSTTSDLATAGRIYADGGVEVQGGDSYFSGEVEIAGQLVEFCEPLGVSVAIDAGLGSMFYKTVSAPATLTFAVGTASEQSVVSFTLQITNSGGARTITWPASVVWPTPGTVPTPTTGVDVYTFYTIDEGVTWRGALVASYAS